MVAQQTPSKSKFQNTKAAVAIRGSSLTMLEKFCFTVKYGIANRVLQNNKHRLCIYKICSKFTDFFLRLYKNLDYFSELNYVRVKHKRNKQIWFSEKRVKSSKILNAYSQNRQQPRLETLMEIANILDVDVKELIISKKKTKWQKQTIAVLNKNSLKQQINFVKT